MRDVLTDRVGRALEPIVVRERLFCGQKLDAGLVEIFVRIRAVNVPVKRRGIKLGQHKNTLQVRIDGIRNRNVHQPVLASKRDRGLGTVAGEREQTFPLSSSENDHRDAAAHGLTKVPVGNSQHFLFLVMLPEDLPEGVVLFHQKLQTAADLLDKNRAGRVTFF